MSHFSVLVVGGDVDAQLAPYHEFECTGMDNEYVQEIDRTEEARQIYAEDRTQAARDPQGELHAFFDEHGEWVPGLSKSVGDGPLDAGRRTYFVPEGWEQVEVPTAQVQSFARFAQSYYGVTPVKRVLEIDRAKAHKYGYVLLTDGGEVLKLVRRTNPNRKWDWYEVGGRWSNFLLTKDGARCDTARKGDVDLPGMRQAAGEKARLDWQTVHAVIAPHVEGFVTWDEMREKRFPGNLDAARDAYHAQPLQRALQALGTDDRARQLTWWAVRKSTWCRKTSTLPLPRTRRCLLSPW